MRKWVTRFVLALALLTLALSGCSKGPRDLTLPELADLTGRARISEYPPSFSGNLYNGNDAITVTEIKVVVFSGVGVKKTSRTYKHDVSIGPMQTASVFFPVLLDDLGAEHEWMIVVAKGQEDK